MFGIHMFTWPCLHPWRKRGSSPSGQMASPGGLCVPGTEFQGSKKISPSLEGLMASRCDRAARDYGEWFSHWLSLQHHVTLGKSFFLSLNFSSSFKGGGQSLH